MKQVLFWFLLNFRAVEDGKNIIQFCDCLRKFPKFMADFVKGEDYAIKLAEGSCPGFFDKCMRYWARGDKWSVWWWCGGKK